MYVRFESNNFFFGLKRSVSHAATSAFAVLTAGEQALVGVDPD
jgi:hypothetical protein